jgi:hypothetical protein
MRSGVKTGMAVLVRPPKNGEEYHFPILNSVIARATVTRVPRGRQGYHTEVEVRYKAGGTTTVPLGAIRKASPAKPRRLSVPTALDDNAAEVPAEELHH